MTNACVKTHETIYHKEEILIVYKLKRKINQEVRETAKEICIFQFDKNIKANGEITYIPTMERSIVNR